MNSTQTKETKISFLEEILQPFSCMEITVPACNTAEMLDDIHSLIFVLSQHPEYMDLGLQQPLATVQRFYSFLRRPIVRKTLDNMLHNAV